MSDESCRLEFKKGFLSVSAAMTHKHTLSHIQINIHILSHKVVKLQAVVEFAKAILKAQVSPLQIPEIGFTDHSMEKEFLLPKLPPGCP